MTWYQEGTISVTQNSSTVAGVSTRWVSNARVGEALVAPDGRIYEVTAIASDKALTISPAYKGATAAGQAYAIVPVQVYVKRLADQAARVLNGLTVDLSEKADKSELPQAVRDAALEGIAFNVATAVLASDTVLQALGKLQAQASNKVDKVTGKVLSSNYFTNTERVKLANIAEQATKNASDAALRDRSTHTGAQPIRTVEGLQPALDGKETPAGALAQMRAFGLGAVAGPLSTDFDGITQTGFYLGNPATSAASGLPITTASHNLIHMSGNPATNAYQIAQPVTVVTANACRTFIRQKNGGSWQSWKELALTDSPSFTGTPSTPNLKLSNSASSDVNTLDYYEEGTWTPTLDGAGITYSHQVGRYTRVGNIVSFSGSLGIPSKMGVANNLRIFGLPFTIKNIAYLFPMFSVGRFTYLNVGSAPLVISASANPATTRIDLYKATTGGVANLVVDDIADRFSLSFSGTYEVQ